MPPLSYISLKGSRSVTLRQCIEPRPFLSNPPPPPARFAQVADEENFPEGDVQDPSVFLESLEWEEQMVDAVSRVRSTSLLSKKTISPQKKRRATAGGDAKNGSGGANGAQARGAEVGDKTEVGSYANLATMYDAVGKPGKAEEMRRAASHRV